MTAESPLPPFPGFAFLNPPLYPPMDLSYFDRPITPAPADILFGYASITWGGSDRQAIEDIAGLGFHGIQLPANVIKEFGSASHLPAFLDKDQLNTVTLSIS